MWEVRWSLELFAADNGLTPIHNPSLNIGTVNKLLISKRNIVRISSPLWGEGYGAGLYINEKLTIP
jgi:hypothetical protein